VPRLSLWREKHSNDYKFIDRTVSEMFTVGGTGVLLHKYLGPANTGGGDATKPIYDTLDPTNIQDLLFVENRDRKYDTTVYPMRGVYTVSDNDFDLTQFGLFLQTGTLFLTFHLNDMVALLGRKIMAGDVVELQHLKDFDGLGDMPTALKRFFVVGDCSRPAEGFSPTWWPHLWRCKLNPLVDSQEYKDILDKIQNPGDPNEKSLRDIVSTYEKYAQINDAVIAQAEIDVPKSGYDTSVFYHKPYNEDYGPSAPIGLSADNDANVLIDASSISSITADSTRVTPDYKMVGYLTGDGLGPNGIPVGTGIAFPENPNEGDYFLRLDYLPNRLFRYSGRRWMKIEDAVRNNMTPGAETNQTQRSTFVNNSNTYVDYKGDTQPERQPLSKVLKPKADN